MDIVGLSGLITPSLDEMVHVAGEMQRQGLHMPLLIGGATTSRVHTAARIDPGYLQAVVHVPDASRAPAVVGHLMDPAQRPSYTAEVKAEYQVVREKREREQAARRMLPLERGPRAGPDRRLVRLRQPP